MFRMLVHEKKSPGEVASSLNDKQIKTDLGRAWTSNSVEAVLSNEKYVDNNVFNRISIKLKKKRVVNSPDMWICAPGTFPAIIQPELFEAAQTALAIRHRHLSDDEMLLRLNRTLPSFERKPLIHFSRLPDSTAPACGSANDLFAREDEEVALPRPSWIQTCSVSTSASASARRAWLIGAPRSPYALTLPACVPRRRPIWRSLRGRREFPNL
jgi:hypothetical protein